jgi:hypothetical protein
MGASELSNRCPEVPQSRAPVGSHFGTARSVRQTTIVGESDVYMFESLWRSPTDG